MKRTSTIFRLHLFCVFFLFAWSAQSQDILISKEATWLYEDDGTDLGTTWRDSGYTATNFVSSQAPFGMGGVDGATMNTTITKRITTYYIKEITLTANNYNKLYMDVMCDDGFVVYINGVEVTRDNLPTGTLNYLSTANTAVSGTDEGDYDQYTASGSFFKVGINLVAVELHNESSGSSDLAFDLELSAIDTSLFVMNRYSTWSYHDSGMDLGTSWYAAAYDHSLWESGGAVLGYGGVTGATITTTVDYGGNSSDKHPTTYFRRSFSLTNPDFALLKISLLADDGAAIYINGKFAFSAGMPTTWNYSTYANHTASGSDEGDYEYFYIPDTFLVNGTNVVAVEVHQTNASSSDLGFDLDILGQKGRYVNGEIFMDMDGNGVKSSFDVFGSGAVEIRIYNDADSNGVLTDAELIESKLTNPYGTYSMFAPEGTRHLAVKLMTEDMDDQVEYTTDTTLTFTLSPGTTPVTANFGQLGPRSLCLLIADDQTNNDQYLMANRISGKNQYIATMETDEIEALAIRIGMDSMWAFDDGQFGSVNISTGKFDSIGTGIGRAFGYVAGVWSSHTMTDIDGLAYDGRNNILYGVERRPGNYDLLVAIDRTSGTFIVDFFGTGKSFVEITGTGIKNDVDDIAFNPTDGQLLAVNNENSGDSTRYISINPLTGLASVISIVGVGDFEGLGYYNTGELYGTTGAVAKTGYPENTFYRINKANGVGTALAPLYAGANDVEACDCLTGPTENLISGVVFYDNDSSGTYDDNIDIAYGNFRVYLYRDANSNGHIDSGDYIIDTAYTDPTTGFYVFITDSLGDFLTTPYIQFTALVNYNTTTDDSLTETASFIFHGDFDGKNDFGFHATAGMQYLPVEWLEVAARWTEKQDATVTWSTTSETNTSHFEVERSTDNCDFEYTGQIEALGNTQSISEYSFIDINAQSLPTQNLIYRIKQVDFDNNFEFSRSVILTKNTTVEVKAFPNPLKDVLNIQLDAIGDYEVSISTMSGTVVKETQGTNYEKFTSIKIEGLNQLKRGIYLLKVTYKGEDTIIKLLK